MSRGPDWPLHLPSGKHSSPELFILDDKQSGATALVFKGQQERRWMERVWRSSAWRGLRIKLHSLCPSRRECKREERGWREEERGIQEWQMGNLHLLWPLQPPFNLLCLFCSSFTAPLMSSPARPKYIIHIQVYSMCAAPLKLVAY